MEIVDKDDKVIGIKDRDEVHALGLRHRIAIVLLYNKNGDVLLQRRSANKNIYPLKWDCSCSEHLKPGESWNAAARRGLKEELGISEVDLKEVLYCRANYGLEGEAISKLFSCTISEVPGKIDEKEVYGYKFFIKSELKELLIKENNAFAKWSSEQLRWILGMPNGLEQITNSL